MNNSHPLLWAIRNKYVLVLLCFVVWMAFFDPKDLGLVWKRQQKLEDLKTSELQVTEQIKLAKKELVLLKTNAATIEKYAREKYYMKKDNEDLFIVKPTPINK
jgi:cell division protein FtsB